MSNEDIINQYNDLLVKCKNVFERDKNKDFNLDDSHIEYAHILIVDGTVHMRWPKEESGYYGDVWIESEHYEFSAKKLKETPND